VLSGFILNWFRILIRGFCNSVASIGDCVEGGIDENSKGIDSLRNVDFACCLKDLIKVFEAGDSFPLLPDSSVPAYWRIQDISQWTMPFPNIAQSYIQLSSVSP
jgi:hypothetical protein